MEDTMPTRLRKTCQKRVAKSIVAFGPLKGGENGKRHFGEAEVVPAQPRAPSTTFFFVPPALYS